MNTHLDVVLHFFIAFEASASPKPPSTSGTSENHSGAKCVQNTGCWSVDQRERSPQRVFTSDKTLKFYHPCLPCSKVVKWNRDVLKYSVFNTCTMRVISLGQSLWHFVCSIHVVHLYGCPLIFSIGITSQRAETQIVTCHSNLLYNVFQIAFFLCVCPLVQFQSWRCAETS